MADMSSTSEAQLSEHFHALLGWSPAKAEGEKVLFAYANEINQLRVESLLRITESAVIDNGSKRKVMKRVGSVLIECLQNIAIHGTKNDNGSSASFVILFATKKGYRLCTGNLILQQDANLLAYKLDQLNTLNPNEIRKQYIETLCNQNYSYKGGAGLGFLTIAKKADGPIGYSTQPVDSRFAFFTCEVNIAEALS